MFHHARGCHSGNVFHMLSLPGVASLNLGLDFFIRSHYLDYCCYHLKIDYPKRYLIFAPFLLSWPSLSSGLVSASYFSISTFWYPNRPRYPDMLYYGCYSLVNLDLQAQLLTSFDELLRLASRMPRELLS